MEFQTGRWPEIEGDEFLLNLGEQWLYQPVAGAGPYFGTDRPVKWGSSERSSLERIIAWVDYWRGQGNEAYALELLLPPDAFETFCRANAVVRLERERPEELDPAARGMALRPSDVGPRI